jgi:hypothetical protein
VDVCGVEQLGEEVEVEADTCVGGEEEAEDRFVCAGQLWPELGQDCGGDLQLVS